MKENFFEKPKLTSEEEKTHQEVLGRQRKLQKVEGEKARELLEKELEKVIIEEKEKK